MVVMRSEQQEVNKERRKDPRLAFHCDATAMGFSGIQTITDISIAGKTEYYRSDTGNHMLNYTQAWEGR